jgi:hypothetical protein
MSGAFPRFGLQSVLALAMLLTASAGWASWVEVPPSLPAPSGRVVNVSTEAQLQSAVANLTSGTTVMIAPGIYHLSQSLFIKGSFSDVVIRGSSNHRDDTVIEGLGVTNSGIEYGMWVGGNLQRLTIANLTIREVYTHPLIFNSLNGAMPQSPRIYNVHLINGGQQLMKVNPGDGNAGSNDGVIEYSLFEYSPMSRDWYANAIQVLAGANWIIRNNLIRPPSGAQAGPAVLSWFGATNTTVEGNTFINCQREISLGLIDRNATSSPPATYDNTGGIIRNNFIYRDASVEGGDVAIGVFDSPNTKVLNNTIYIAGSYPNAVEYRFPQSTGVLIVNNLTNKAITSREGATATVTNNHTAATLSMFINAPIGDLRLVVGATAAIDKAVLHVDVPTDWEGNARPSGAAPDLGAHELRVDGGLPMAPRNLHIVR